MTEEELTPYLGQRVALQLDQEQLPEPQRGQDVSGVLLRFVDTMATPPERIALLGENPFHGVVTVSLCLILGVTVDQA
jgi:hypothetical protein